MCTRAWPSDRLRRPTISYSSARHFLHAWQIHHASLSTAPELRQHAVHATADTSCHLVRAEGLRLALLQLRNEGVELILSQMDGRPVIDDLLVMVLRPSPPAFRIIPTARYDERAVMPPPAQQIVHHHHIGWRSPGCSSSLVQSSRSRTERPNHCLLGAQSN